MIRDFEKLFYGFCVGLTVGALLAAGAGYYVLSRVASDTAGFVSRSPPAAHPFYKPTPLKPGERPI